MFYEKHFTYPQNISTFSISLRTQKIRLSPLLSYPAQFNSSLVYRATITRKQFYSRLVSEMNRREAKARCNRDLFGLLSKPRFQIWIDLFGMIAIGPI